MLALQTLWALINVLVKVSILDLYVCPSIVKDSARIEFSDIRGQIRIFRVRSLKILAYILMALSVAYFICVFLEAMLLCHPLAFNWDKTIPGGSCGNITAAYEAVGIYNLLTDAFIIILPMPWLWALQLPKAKKLGLTAIFALGFAYVGHHPYPLEVLVLLPRRQGLTSSAHSITAISTIRVISLAVWDFSDFSYGLGRVAIWSVLEPTLGIINCCLPILQPALAKFTRSSIWTSRAGGVSSATPKIVASGSSGSHLATIGGSGMGGPRKFRRLGDEYEYPLNDMQSTTGTEGQWAGARGYDEEEAGDESPTRWANNQSAPPPPKKNAIAVKQDWNVEYDRR